MRPLTTLAWLLVLAGCPSSPGVVEWPDPHGLDAGDQTSGCLADSACPTEQVCVNCGGVGECTPGCRDASQCRPGEICQLGTACESCPCPPGWCTIDPCRDDDRDGYAATADPNVSCPGKLEGDCDDRDPTVHPGAPEVCTNGRDDNCDGTLDERDPACVCIGGAARCNTAWDCGTPGIDSCEKGCCTRCSTYGDGNCGTQYCPTRYGVNTNGCSFGTSCSTCGTCPHDGQPVCGTNFSTYANECLARLSLGYGNNTTRVVRHLGACLPGEGIACSSVSGSDGGCDPGGTLYCRNDCPEGASCGANLCAQRGGCAVDADCPAGLAVPDCDGGFASVSCLSGACVFACR